LGDHGALFLRIRQTDEGGIERKCSGKTIRESFASIHLDQWERRERARGGIWSGRIIFSSLRESRNLISSRSSSRARSGASGLKPLRPTVAVGSLPIKWILVDQENHEKANLRKRRNCSNSPGVGAVTEGTCDERAHRRKKLYEDYHRRNPPRGHSDARKVLGITSMCKKNGATEGEKGPYGTYS